MSGVRVAYAGGGSPSQGNLFTYNYSDGAGGWIASATTVTDAAGNFYTRDITASTALTTGTLFLGSDQLTSFSRDAVASVQFELNNVKQWLISNGSIKYGSGYNLLFGSAANPTQGVVDSGIGRDSAGVLKIRLGTTGTGALLFHHPLINISSTQLLDDTNEIVNCTANTFDVDLPTAVGIKGKKYTIKNSGAGVITANPDGTETIDGDFDWNIQSGDWLIIVSDGTNWIIIG